MNSLPVQFAIIAVFIGSCAAMAWYIESAISMLNISTYQTVYSIVVVVVVVVLVALWKYCAYIPRLVIGFSLGFVVSIFIGDVVVHPLWQNLPRLSPVDIIPEPFCVRLAEIVQVPELKASPRVPRWLGIIERILFMMLVAWNVTGAASFIGTWIAIKTAGMAWQVFSSAANMPEWLLA